MSQAGARSRSFHGRRAPTGRPRLYHSETDGDAEAEPARLAPIVRRAEVGRLVPEATRGCASWDPLARIRGRAGHPFAGCGPLPLWGRSGPQSLAGMAPAPTPQRSPAWLAREPAVKRQCLALPIRPGASLQTAPDGRTRPTKGTPDERTRPTGGRRVAPRRSRQRQRGNSSGHRAGSPIRTNRRPKRLVWLDGAGQRPAGAAKGRTGWDMPAAAATPGRGTCVLPAKRA